MHISTLAEATNTAAGAGAPNNRSKLDIKSRITAPHLTAIKQRTQGQQSSSSSTQRTARTNYSLKKAIANYNNYKLTGNNVRETTEDRRESQRTWLNQRKSRASPKMKSKSTPANPSS
ncbi:hypothetical protein Nepgr_033881 [Nepenthes gracilis]|uniref:Uncharacterized protein n=1 Tax=Nepenthes gracilis TaxID=150966 RepID=A0AAD3Y6Z4_NEPGR|nr:hypothetical protein Nepgr_033881 [Nepenthes gracilis]